MQLPSGPEVWTKCHSELPALAYPAHATELYSEYLTGVVRNIRVGYRGLHKWSVLATPNGLEFATAISRNGSEDLSGCACVALNIVIGVRDSEK